MWDLYVGSLRWVFTLAFHVEFYLGFLRWIFTWGGSLRGVFTWDLYVGSLRGVFT